MKPVLGLTAIIAIGLSGCAGSLTGLEGESKFACKAPDGVTCSSLSGIYANAVANNPFSAMRSVPRMTVSLAFAAAAAIVDQARLRNSASGGGIGLPGTRYPGTKHSGKQRNCARSDAA